MQQLASVLRGSLDKFKLANKNGRENKTQRTKKPSCLWVRLEICDKCEGLSPHCDEEAGSWCAASEKGHPGGWRRTKEKRPNLVNPEIAVPLHTLIWQQCVGQLVLTDVSFIATCKSSVTAHLPQAPKARGRLNPKILECFYGNCWDQIRATAFLLSPQKRGRGMNLWHLNYPWSLNSEHQKLRKLNFSCLWKLIFLTASKTLLLLMSGEEDTTFLW